VQVIPKELADVVTTWNTMLKMIEVTQVCQPIPPNPNSNLDYKNIIHMQYATVPQGSHGADCSCKIGMYKFTL